MKVEKTRENKFTYNTIESLSNSDLKKAYKELKEGLPKGDKSVVRNIQSVLYHENGETISMIKVKYQIAMEMLKRFYD